MYARLARAFYFQVQCSPYATKVFGLLKVRKAGGSLDSPIKIVIDTPQVRDRIADLLKKQDLSKFIL